MNPRLFELLRCPDEHHSMLTHDPERQTLTCVGCHRSFEIRNGVPVLLPAR